MIKVGDILTFNMLPDCQYLVTRIDKIGEQDIFTNYIHLLCITGDHEWTHKICRWVLKNYTKVGTIDDIKR